jgi:outer membrane protein TolC
MTPLLLAVALAAGPITLDDALAEAARASSDLALARNDLLTAREQVGSARAGVLPRLDLTTSAGRRFVGAGTRVTTIPTGAAGGEVAGVEREVTTPARSFGDYALSLTLRQPIFDAFASWRRIDAARAGARAAERQVDEAGLAVAFDVTRRFYEVVRAVESLRVLEETVRRSEEVLARAEALFIAGRAPKSEAIQARVNLENDRIRVEQQRAALGAAQADLASALGRTEPDIAVVPPETVTGAAMPDAEPPPGDVLRARALTRRPLLAAQRARIAQASATAAAARGAYWPVLDARLGYTRAGTDAFGTDAVFGDPTRQYTATAQLVLAWNLYAGGETRAAARTAELGADRARIELARAEADVGAEIARARAASVAQASAARIAQAALAAAEEGASAARQRFEAGAATQLEVRDAELNLTRTRLALLEARIDHVVARADLARATGGALE